MQKRFNEVAVIEETGLRDWALDALRSLTIGPFRTFHTSATDETELIRRIGSADGVFLSWTTQLNEHVLRESPNIQFIGLCCSLYDPQSSNVDVDFAQRTGITVRGIRDYGDEGVVEFITCELIRLLKGLGAHQWQDEPVELTNRKIGIIGLGTVGSMLARRLRAFGGDLFYYSRSRKPEAEAEGVQYLPLDQLLETVDMISFHVPRGTELLDAAAFRQFGNGKILINTSLGPTFDQAAFEHWMQHPGNYAIMDGDGLRPDRAVLEDYPNLIYRDIVSGWTREARERLSRKVLENAHRFLGGGQSTK